MKKTFYLSFLLFFTMSVPLTQTFSQCSGLVINCLELTYEDPEVRLTFSSMFSYIKDVDHFEIEHSSNNCTVSFYAITSINLSNSNSFHINEDLFGVVFDYYVTTPCFGNNCYRVKIIYEDNSFEYSNEVYFSNNVSATSMIWQNQTTSKLIVANSSSNPNAYCWREHDNNQQGVSINVIGNETGYIFLQSNNHKIQFNAEQFWNFVYLEVFYEGKSEKLKDGNPKVQHVLWGNSVNAFNSLGDPIDLTVKWLKPLDNTIYMRDYKIYVVPQSSMTFTDNIGNTMKLWEASIEGEKIPILISEGIDQYDTDFEEKYFGLGANFYMCLLQKGFKIYFLNYKHNAQDMKHNAAVYTSAVKYISQINGNRKIIACGVSMGGVIVRYALAKAEEEGNPLPVSKFVSIDAPQQGANVSIELQKVKYQFESDDAFASYSLNNTATKQMLNKNVYVSAVSNNTIKESFYNDNTPSVFLYNKMNHQQIYVE